MIDYRTAEIVDIAAETARITAAGALVIWDLSHAAGVHPVGPARGRRELAVGCTYKFLNGGPGAPAFAYVAREIIDSIDNPIHGWFSQHDQFAMDDRTRRATTSAGCSWVHRASSPSPPRSAGSRSPRRRGSRRSGTSRSRSADSASSAAMRSACEPAHHAMTIDAEVTSVCTSRAARELTRRLFEECKCARRLSRARRDPPRMLTADDAVRRCRAGDDRDRRALPMTRCDGGG